MERKPLFWITVLVLVVLSVVFIARYGNKVFFFDTPITMSLKSSRASADSLNKALGIKLNGYKSSSAFLTDNTFQSYVELRAGGKNAFLKVMNSGVYHPLYWYVRQFKPGETRELEVQFSPVGKLLGFREKVPEADKTASLSRGEAQTLAETEAVNRWEVDLSKYKLIEAQSDTKPNGRIDHSFTYELQTEKIGEALYRMKIVVSGDRLTTLMPDVKIPDKFVKEYEEMRSYNETLASVASGIMQLLFGVAIIVWFIVFLRQRKLNSKPALKWAILIAILMIIASLNYWSFYWLDYDTSAAPGGFIAQQLLIIIMEAVLMGALAWITIMVAEALTREAFPNQVQLWHLADKDTAPTKDVLGKVLMGYFAVPLSLAFTVGFYGFMSSRFGWWASISNMSDPNILATFSPFLSAIGGALQPGFWEEAMFRAIPLATCVILGRKFQQRGLFFIIGMIIQIFVFSAAHASYPQQPFYFRLVELIFFSLLMAFLYFRFGLVTAVIAHFADDAVLMNLSSFTTKAPGMWLDRTLFIIVLFIPLWVVLYQKFRIWQKPKGYAPIWLAFFTGWKDVPESKLNRAWTPTKVEEITFVSPDVEVVESKAEEPMVETSTTKANIFMNKPIFRYILAGFIAFVLLSMFLISSEEVPLKYAGQTYIKPLDLPRLEISSRKAVDIATAQLHMIMTKTNKPFPQEFKPYPTYFRSPQDQIYAVTKDKKDFSPYFDVINKYLFIDGWEVRFRNYKGNLDERSESYSIFLTAKGNFISYAHVLPEDREGKNLSEEEARVLALQALQKADHKQFPFMKEVLVSPQKLPKRTDWSFTYEDSVHYGLQECTPRVTITISGDEVSSVNPFIYLTEELQRQTDKESQLAGIFRIIAMVLSIAFLVWAVVFCIMRWSRNELKTSYFWIILMVFSLLAIVNVFFSWNFIVGRFNPIEPYHNNLITYYISFAVGLIFKYGAFALLFSYGAWFLAHKKPPRKTDAAIVFPVYYVPLFIIITSKWTLDWAIFRIPPWDEAMVSLPLLPFLIKLAGTGLMWFGLAMFLFGIFDRISSGFTRKRHLVYLLAFLTGFTLAIRNVFTYFTPTQIYAVLGTGFVYGIAIFAVYSLYRICTAREVVKVSYILFSAYVLNCVLIPSYPAAVVYYLVAYVILLLPVLIEVKVETVEIEQ